MNDWHQIVEQYGVDVWRIVYRLVNDQSDAEDCFQEVFLAALRLAERGEVRDHSRLLRRIAYVQGMRCLRDRYRGRPTNVDSPNEVEVPKRRPSPCDIAQETELVEALRCALAQLPHAQAEAHCLRYQGGWTYEEIASELGVSISNVGVLLNRARKQLSVLLAPFNDSVESQRE